MTNTKTTKRALLASVLSIVMCFAMLIGSTFAWFTDSATTGTNVIKSGNLDIGFEYADGKVNPDSAKWENAENAKIFDYSLWEPGYTVAKHIKISNKGSLALKYQVSFKLDGAIGKLAEVIDVYFVDPASAIATRNDVNNLTSIGTLDKYLTGDVVFGDLKAGKSNTVTVVLKMKEEANNDYQNKSVGDGLTIVINATQDTVESDSFDNQYDKGAMLPDEKLIVTDDTTLTEAINAKTDYTVNAGGYKKVVVADGVNVTVNGGNFENQIIAARNGATVTIKNASGRTGNRGQDVIANVNSGSTVVFEGGNYPLFNSLLYGDGTGTVIIKGGYFDGGCFYYTFGASPVANLTITGGTFGPNFMFMADMMGPSLSEFVPDTHQIINNSDNSCTVIPK